MNLKRMYSSLALAAVMIAAAAALRYMQAHDIISRDSGGRAVQVMIGLVLVFFANAMPKDIGSWRGSPRAARLQSSLRVGGWSLTVAGLCYAGLGAFARGPFADTAAIAVVAAATAVTVATAAWNLFACRRTENTPTITTEL
jgi:hypothetical protein